MNSIEQARQQVIALGFWISAVQSDNMHPPWDGATLGGRQRMKGYDGYRLWDKADIYTVRNTAKSPKGIRSRT
ncbi:hypothetical protein [Maridesulfovibrio sp. FT414]|uniref:hypothetical protein n=1 Tax=Maridesulfovibrio sp. FT414 TaxID=2979469 RepID=UPI003D8067E9